MRKLVVKLVVVTGLLLAASCGYASEVKVVFLGYGFDTWQDGYPYRGYIQGEGLTPLLCDDYVHGGSRGDVFVANLANLGTEGIGTARFNQLPNALTLYKEAGWLLTETKVTYFGQWDDINYAIWHIFDPASPIDQRSQFWFNAAMLEAQLGFPGVDFNQVNILTPVDQYDPDPNGMQEFLFLTGGWPWNPIRPGPGPHRLPGDLAEPSGQTPEPGTLLLVATGALGLFGRKLFP